MSDLVSILIPTRNRRVLLERAINSALQQSHKNIELVIANDGSTDDTADFLNSWARTEPRLRVLHLEGSKGSPAAARNRALHAAGGRYVTGLDDDDEFHPQRIEFLLSEYKSFADSGRSFSCVFSGLMMYEGDRLMVGDRKNLAEIDYLDLFKANPIGNPVFCLKERLIAIGGYDEGLFAWEDIDLLIRLLRKYGRALKTAKPTYICHADQGRARMSNNEDRLRAAFLRIYEKNGDVPPAVRIQLFAPLFYRYHGVKPRISDWIFALKAGAKFPVYVQLARTPLEHQFRAIRRRFVAT